MLDIKLNDTVELIYNDYGCFETLYNDGEYTSLKDYNYKNIVCEIIGIHERNSNCSTDAFLIKEYDRIEVAFAITSTSQMQVLQKVLKETDYLKINTNDKYCWVYRSQLVPPEKYKIKQNVISQIKNVIYGGKCSKCLKDYPYAEITDINTFKCWECKNGF